MMTLAHAKAKLKEWKAKRTHAAKRVTAWTRTVARAQKAHAASASHVSQAGVDLVASFEGFRSAPYRDAVGVWTIGYGHTAGVGPNTPPWTQAQAKQALRSELDGRYADAVRALHLPLTQNQFDALTSFVYNVGPGYLGKGHTIGDALRARQWAKAADALLLYDVAGGQHLAGLTRRRQAERALFLKGA